MAEVPSAEVETETPAPPAPAAPRKREDAQVALPRGTCIGRYVIVDVLGAGGMGVVYRAYDPDLDRRIALKLLRDDRREPARLIEEAQTLAKMSHPNVVQVYDVGLVDDQVFITMELVEGETVHGWWERTRPSRRQILDVFLAAGRGLAAAHAAGIVHRDFKPSNVLIGADGRVRVADFGLARADASVRERSSPGERTTPGSPSGLPSSRSSPSSLAARISVVTAAATERATAPTRDERPPTIADLDDPEATADLDGAAPDDHGDSSLPRVVASRVMGTPAYMAPEQRRQRVYDARVDQYSFAVALYEALYGELPFVGKNSAARAIEALADRVRPPARGADVPPHVRRALIRALRANPEDRFPTIDALLVELARDPERTRRRILLAAGGALVLVALAMGIAMRARASDPCADAEAELAGIWDGDVAARVDAALRATKRPYAAAVATHMASELGARAKTWASVRRAACEARAHHEVSDDLADRQTVCLDRRASELRALTAALARGPDPALLDHAVDALGALPQASACGDRTALLAIPPPADPALRAKVAALRAQLAEAAVSEFSAEYRAARDKAAALAHDADRLGYAPVIAEARYTAGLAARRANDFARAETLFTGATEAAAIARDDALAADAWIDLVGIVGYELGHPADARLLLRAAVAAVARLDASPTIRARLLDAQALIASGTGDVVDAINRAREALAIREAQHDDIAIAESANNLALLLSEHGDYAEAEALHRRALALRTHLLGDAHPLVADSLDNVGVVLYHEGKTTEARALYERALALREAAAPGGRDTGTSYNNLGGLFLDLGDDARAAEYLGKTLAIWEQALGRDHPDLAIPLSNLGDLANKRGDHARARELCERARAIDEASHGAEASGLPYDLACLGEAELALAPRDAVVHLERALALRLKTGGEPGELARTRFVLAQALVATGGDAGRARTLATGACGVLAGLGGTWKRRADACAAWLAKH